MKTVESCSNRSKEIHFKDVGNVLFRKTSRSKYVRITIKGAENIIVSLPKYVSYSYAEQVVMNKLDWIKKTLDKDRVQKKKYIFFDESTKFRTKLHKFIIQYVSTDQLFYKISDEVVLIQTPDNAEIPSDEVQKEIREIIIKVLRLEAKEYLPKRVDQLSKRFGLSYNKIFVKNLRSRWGSCSVKNNINLNIHLMRLPDHLIDYIILHELAHTVERNHSKKYWHFLETLLKDARILDKEIKMYSPSIF